MAFLIYPSAIVFGNCCFLLTFDIIVFWPVYRFCDNRSHFESSHMDQELQTRDQHHNASAPKNNLSEMADVKIAGYQPVSIKSPVSIQFVFVFNIRVQKTRNHNNIM